jgi:hypothetical protein
MLKKRRVHRGVSAVAGIGLVMDVLMRIAAVNGGGVDIARIKLENLRLVMIDPDDGVVVTAHDSLVPVKSDGLTISSWHFNSVRICRDPLASGATDRMAVP